MDEDAGTVAAPQDGGAGDPLASYINRTWHIESGGNPAAQTGSQRGLGQWSPDLEARYGINDQNRGDPNVQFRALQQEATEQYPVLSRVLGRPPTPGEMYMAHQQGLAGATNHFNNPDAPAWQNMAATGEGKQKGERWARAAIWGNIPDDPRTSPNFNKTMFPGGVDQVTSRAFTSGWINKFEGGGGGGPVQMANSGGPPTWMPQAQTQAQDQAAARQLAQTGSNVAATPQMQPAAMSPMAAPQGQNPYTPAAMRIRAAIQSLGGPGGGPPVGTALPRVPGVRERLIAMLQQQRAAPQQQQDQG